jgi:hypothetical protein
MQKIKITGDSCCERIWSLRTNLKVVACDKISGVFHYKISYIQIGQTETFYTWVPWEDVWISTRGSR